MASSFTEENGVELGFVEQTPNWKLRSKHFPSKVGGKPSWLHLKQLPTTNELLCGKCRKPCAFLLQVYAPLEEESPSCFHRTVFVFACTEPDCCERNSSLGFKAFRCQLPRLNDTYDAEPAKEEENDSHPEAGDFNSLCAVCGCRASFRCSKCHKIHYCSGTHQVMDWKNGHKRLCPNDDPTSRSSTFLLKEYELVTEPEPSEEKKDAKTEEEAIEEYQKFLESEKAQSQLNESDEAIENEIGDLAQKEDKQYRSFMKRIHREPEQVLRYERCGQPLWVSGENKLKEADVPPCACGAPRQFEFQILPQLLNHLHLDKLDNSVDWGTLVVYTCSKNCVNDTVYHHEFIWKQDFSNSNNVPFT